MWLVKNPEWFDVVVTTNIFGDIFTDLGAMIQGGMGIAASGNIHPGQVSMFEPIHGSAPKYKDKNIACPIAAIMAAQMMLDFLGENKAAEAIEDAIASLLGSGSIKSLDAKSGIPTSEMGNLVVKEIIKNHQLNH
jgi:3-isopropylmalate dehydrogenase